ncbi:hypothetical protein PORY_000294 [Pneumocystis oryctolagi]|uniref:Uncharacterized protein n=1 Tax=Pneumocystis oryctolagi TaxID=42067 RepID=A0ACB7CF51_9ASCO|nr:hypothetical protein PORY_000294 [Pneumocystis oryctolagi]
MFGFSRFYSMKSVITPRNKKAFLHSNYLSLIQSHSTFLLVQQNGINSKGWRFIRKQLRELNTNIKFLRSRLFIRALQTAGNDIKEHQNECVSLQSKASALKALEKLLIGPTAIITLPNHTEPSCLRQIINLINKNSKQLQILGGLFENELVDTKALSIIKTLPSRSALHAQLVYSLTAMSNEFSQALEYSGEILALIFNSKTHNQQSNDTFTTSKTSI